MQKAINKNILLILFLEYYVIISGNSKIKVKVNITSVVDAAVQFHDNRATVDLLYEGRKCLLSTHFL